MDRRVQADAAMQPIRDRLEDLARRAPSVARGLLRRLGDVVREKREAVRPSRQPASAPAAPAPAPPAPEVRAPTKNWELSSQAELVDHIEQHYHAGLRSDLPKLIAAARKLEREHASHASVPSGLTDVLSELSDALEGHMSKEETILFPVIKGGARGDMSIDMPMRMMEREHDDHANELEKIRDLTNNLTAPADASEAWTSLYAGLTALEIDLQQHIYLENNVLFVRASGGR